MPLRRTEEDIVQSIVTAGGQNEQIVLKIALAFTGFSYEREAIFLCLYDFVGDRLTGSFGHTLEVGNDTIGVLLGV